jgi:hypothetical protein
MMKMFQLQKINKQINTDAAQTGEQKKPENKDLTGWLISTTWSGDVEQAGRKLEFDLAYTTRDKAWQNPELELGDEVLLPVSTIRRSKLSTFFRDAFLAAAGRAALP